MTPEQRQRFRQRAAEVRAMVHPGGLIEPVQRALIDLQLDIVDALLNDESVDLTQLRDPVVILGAASSETRDHVCRVDPLLFGACVTLDLYADSRPGYDPWVLVLDEVESWELPRYEFLHCDWPKP